ncbi:hypothetical protein [Actinomadura fibrosa]|uniref:Uncharacterized protein n=1 Tax=Actinomadura fibrosa TaxID=111802 RepID=A0ABW2XYT4_9ACTN|nr:hypothetical protein [Actinomadura fibrosa]
MKPTTLLALAGAVGGTVLATAGVAALVLDGDGGGSTRPAASARSYESAGAIGTVLRRNGATGCTADASRVECRYAGRYVAAIVLTPSMGLTADAALQSWRTGVAQSALGDDGAFAVLQGPNWLVTGPDELVGGVRPSLGGRMLRCDRPYGTCTS